MNIDISERLRPFSHQPGTSVLVPGSDWVVQVFPTLLKVQGMEVPLCQKGPVRGFTVQSDLEKGCVWIWGTSPEGYFRFQLIPSPEGLILRRKNQEQLLVAGGEQFTKKDPERIFLGCHKAQDLDLARRRIHSTELAPMLFLLGQKVPGNAAEVAFDGIHFEESFSSFYLSSFAGLFCSHAIDPLHQGMDRKLSSGNLLSGAYQAIRKLLLDGSVILPNLPSNWISGRATNFQTPFGRIDFEWRRGMVRRLFLEADQPAPFQFGPSVRNYRTQSIGKMVLYDNFLK